MMRETDPINDSDDDERAATPRDILQTIIKIDFSYILNTWIGRLKLIEFICVTFAGIILPSVIGVFFTRYSFYTFIIWTSFMYIFIDLLLHVTSLWKFLPKTCRSPSILIYPLLIGALAFLIGSALVASSSDLLPGSRATRSGISSAFGFITMVCYIAEAVLHHLSTRENQSRGGGHTAEIQRRSSPAGVISMPINRNGGDYPPPYDG